MFSFNVVFIYSCPGFKSPVKERMLYSSCKQPFTTAVSQDLDLKISKKVHVKQYTMYWVFFDSRKPSYKNFRPLLFSYTCSAFNGNAYYFNDFYFRTHGTHTKIKIGRKYPYKRYRISLYKPEVFNA